MGDLRRLGDESWSFRVLVDVRPWAGRILSSRRVGSIAEALLLRNRLEGAKREGWETLRAAWADCMSTQDVRRGRASLQGDARECRLRALENCRAAVEKRGYLSRS